MKCVWYRDWHKPVFLGVWLTRFLFSTCYRFLTVYFHLRRRFFKIALPVSGHAQPLDIPSEMLWVTVSLGSRQRCAFDPWCALPGLVSFPKMCRRRTRWIKGKLFTHARVLLPQSQPVHEKGPASVTWEIYVNWNSLNPALQTSRYPHTRNSEAKGKVTNYVSNTFLCEWKYLTFFSFLKIHNGCLLQNIWNLYIT